MRSIVLAAFLLGAGVLATGCTATVASDPYPPDLVYAAPGVQVIADYNEPIFYSDGFYWRQIRRRLVPVVVLHGRLGLCVPAGRRDSHRSAARVRALPAARLGGPFAGRWPGARVRLARFADDARLPGGRRRPLTVVRRRRPVTAAHRRPRRPADQPRSIRHRAPRRRGRPRDGAPPHGGGWRGGPH